MRLLCVHCELGPITPESEAALCESCRFGVACGDYQVREISDTLFIVSGGFWCPFRPDLSLASLVDSDILSKMRADLLRLASVARGNSGRAIEIARKTLQAIRELGREIRWDTFYTRARIDYPRRLPPELLADFVEYQPDIEALLIQELAADIRYRAELRDRLAREAEHKRNGADQNGQRAVQGEDMSALQEKIGD